MGVNRLKSAQDSSFSCVMQPQGVVVFPADL